MTTSSASAGVSPWGNHFDSKSAQAFSARANAVTFIPNRQANRGRGRRFPLAKRENIPRRAIAVPRADFLSVSCLERLDAKVRKIADPHLEGLLRYAAATLGGMKDGCLVKR